MKKINRLIPNLIVGLTVYLLSLVHVYLAIGAFVVLLFILIYRRE
jgi:hypothetical protein